MPTRVRAVFIKALEYVCYTPLVRKLMKHVGMSILSCEAPSDIANAALKISNHIINTQAEFCWKGSGFNFADLHWVSSSIALKTSLNAHRTRLYSLLSRLENLQIVE